MIGIEIKRYFSKRFLPIIVGALLYGALTVPFNTFETGYAWGIIVKPTIVIPIIFGIVFGPFAGFVVGLIGNIFSDFVSYGGVFWNWEIANGLLGAIPGIAYLAMSRSQWAKARGLAMAAVLAIVASVVGVGFATMTDYIFNTGASPVGSALAEFYLVAGSYAVNGAILTPLVLYAYAIATSKRARA